MRLSKNYQTAFIALSVMPFFQNAIGLKYPLMGLIVQYSRYIVLFIIMILIVMNQYAITYLAKNYEFYLVLLLIIVFLSSALINKTDVPAVFQLALYMVFPYLLFSICNGKFISMTVICNGLTCGLNILVLINLLIMIIMPQGLFQTISSNTISHYYLFGAKNQMVAPVMTCIFFNVESSYRKYKKITWQALLICLICVVELLMGGSGTGLVVLFCFFILATVELRHHRNNSSLSLVLLFISFIGIVLIRIQDIFSFIIVNLLHKTLTLSDRTYIWDSAIRDIIKHPLFGTGITKSLSGNVHLQLSYLTKDIFAHDMYLDYLLMGGVPALFIFISLLLIVKRTYNSILDNGRQTFIWWGIVIYLFASIVEIYTSNYCLFLMFGYMQILAKSSRLN